MRSRDQEPEKKVVKEHAYELSIRVMLRPVCCDESTVICTEPVLEMAGTPDEAEKVARYITRCCSKATTKLAIKGGLEI